MQEHREGRIDEAVKGYRTAISTLQDSFEAHYNLGLRLRTQGDSAQAQKAFQDAVKINPLFRPAFKNLADVLRKQGREREARAAWERYLQL